MSCLLKILLIMWLSMASFYPVVALRCNQYWPQWPLP